MWGLNGVRRLDVSLYGFQRVAWIADGARLRAIYQAHSSFIAADMRQQWRDAGRKGIVLSALT